MSFVNDVAQAIYDQGWATALRESEVAFPVLQVVHIVGVVLTAGTIYIVDFRLLGWTLRDMRVGEVTERLTAFTWVGFIAMLLSGGALLAAEAAKLVDNIPLRVKLAALLLAGANMAVFQWRIYAGEPRWGAAPVPPAPARIAALISLASWTTVIVGGRLIPYY